MPWCALLDRRLLALSGPDARKFLNGLVTIDALKLDQPRYGLLLTPQGKYLHDFFLIPRGDDLWLDCASARADALLAALKRYRLRAAVEIAPVDAHVFVCWNAPIPEDAFPDPRLPALGARCFLPSHGEEASEAEYDAHRLSFGIPEGEKDLVAEKSFPMQWGLDRLHAIDFDKGCYVGQEVTARSKFRARLRKSPFRITFDAPIPPPGSPIIHEGKEVGELRSSRDGIGIALLDSETPKGAKLYAENIPLRAFPPAWFTSSGESSG